MSFVQAHIRRKSSPECKQAKDKTAKKCEILHVGFGALLFRFGFFVCVFCCCCFVFNFLVILITDAAFWGKKKICSFDRYLFKLILPNLHLKVTALPCTSSLYFFIL